MSEREQLETALELLRRCNDGFSAFIVGRKMARRDRDKLRADLENFLMERKTPNVEVSGDGRTRAASARPPS